MRSRVTPEPGPAGIRHRGVVLPFPWGLKIEPPQFLFPSNHICTHLEHFGFEGSSIKSLMMSDDLEST